MNQALKPLLMLVPAALALGACGEQATLPVAAGMGPHPALPPPEQDPDPDRQHRPGQGLAGGRSAGRRRRASTVAAVRRRARPSALALRAAERRRAGRRDQRAAAARGRQGHQGLGHEACCMKKAGAGGAERQPHHAAARRRRRRRRRDAHGVPRGPATRRSAWRWSATTSTSPTPTRWCAFPTRRAQTRDRRRRASKVVDLPGGPAQPPLDQEPHRQPRRHASSTSTVGSNSNVAENGMDEGGGPRRDLGDRSRDRRASRLRLRPAQSGRHGLGAARPARCGPRSTSATSSAATSCPTT